MSKDILIDGIAESVLNILPKAKAALKDTYAKRPDLKLRGIQVIILDLIAHEGALSMGKLSSSLAIAKANTTPLVADLIDRGLLCRKRYEKDRRIVLIDLTDKGWCLQRKIRNENMEQFKARLTVLKEADLAQLNEVILSLSGLLDQWLTLTGAE